MNRNIKTRKKENGTDNLATDNAKAAVARPGSILEAFETIVEKAEGSKLDSDFMDRVALQVKYVARKLRLSPMQIVLLALFVDRSESATIRISEIAEYTGCRTTKILRLSKDVDELERLHYVRASRSKRSLTYRVPLDVIDALKNNQPYTNKETRITSTPEFFDHFARLAKEKSDDELTYENFAGEVTAMLSEIKDSVLARELKGRYLEEDQLMLFLYMAHLFVENNDDAIGFYDIDDLYDDGDIPNWCKRGLRKRTLDLFECKLIENVNEDGMARSDQFKLTDLAKETVLAEMNLSTVGQSDKGLVKSDSLPEKQLIYNAAERKQIDQLSSILTQDRFKGVQERLRKAGMRPGFCCIFYGAPGTGKTESVYQIARQTGRDIMRVDVDKIKSCWVGESEKNIKSLFDRYRSICKSAAKAPILLFNEADAVLGVRMEGASRAVDKMENSIQNIILQEMESLDGIMIATTNLTTNLDKAFERRFLYKVRFDKPSVEARAEIWKVMLPALAAADASTLAEAFDLSGGEIENIARKHSVAAILSGDDTIDINALTESCRHERITSPTRPRVGF